jgi:hypothetical protein
MLRYVMTRTWMSVVSLFVASGVAFLLMLVLSGATYFSLFCMGPSLQSGANIDHASKLVGFTGLAGLVALLALQFMPERGRVLGALLFLQAGALIVGLGLVAADSARYVEVYSDNGCTTGREVHDVAWLLGVWGALTVVLLLRAVGAWRGVKRLDSTEPRGAPLTSAS